MSVQIVHSELNESKMIPENPKEISIKRKKKSVNFTRADEVLYAYLL